MTLRIKTIGVAVVAAVLLALLAFAALPTGNPEDHTHNGGEAHHSWALPSLFTLDKSDANSTSYCPARDYNRNGYHFDYRGSYIRGNTHYHRYIRTPGLVTINRACALV